MTKDKKFNLNHQWGAETNTAPLAILHTKPSTFKLTLSRLAIVTTVVFWVLYIFSIIIRQLLDGPQNYDFTMEAFSYSLVVTFLTFSSLMYLITRHGALERFAKHMRVPRAHLDMHFAKNKPAITVLVPSYKEEYPVVRKTLISAALQEYPNKRVVLLVDDNPNPKNPNDAESLAKTRAIGTDIKSYLAKPHAVFKDALRAFDKTFATRSRVTAKDVQKLAHYYDWAAKWLNKTAAKEAIHDHVDVFFTDQVLRELAQDLKLVGEALRLAIKDGAPISKARLHQLYLRLYWTFTCEVTVFERKKYASLSHEANKAMNLNSYIGLMGGVYKEVETPEGLILAPAGKKDKNTLKFPDSDFLLTLDADSILLREYCLRLVYFLQQPANARVAVTQTPYSSYRGAYSRIERLAGATTDVQHVLHQGMTYYGATFWVGANAVIRKAALNDIVETELVNGFEVKRFIQDRTVIEDTESSIDLKLKGWQLINYPERLSYSATPPDFGSLVVQRRRWANGGLLILAKLWSHNAVKKSKNEDPNKMEFLLRLNYMASIAWATFGLIFLLAYPYNGKLLSPLVLLSALPYFLTMAADLKYNRYNYTDIFRIYGFNLIMLPVNLAGVIKSLEQAATGKKIPFARTPKVQNRTATPPLYLITPLLIVAFSIFTVWRNVLVANWGNAAFAAVNAILATWAIISYIGITNLLVDLWLGMTDFLYVEDKPKTLEAPTPPNPAINWRAVLYHGDTKSAIPNEALYGKNLA